MSASPIISVIIPCYNAGCYLIPAIGSILKQSLSQWESIVIDDGSTDGSVELAQSVFKDPRIHWIKQSNAGKPATVNRAISISSGEFIALQDADDLSYPQRLEKQLQAFTNEPDLGAVFCGHDIIINNQCIAPLSTLKERKACRREINSFRLPAHDPTIMFRKNIGKELLFDTKLTIGEGLDFILRLGEKHPMLVLDETLYSYRVNPKSMTQQADRFLRQQLVAKVIKKACQRRGVSFEILHPNLKKLIEGDDRFVDNTSRLSTHFMDSVVSQRLKGKGFEALKTAIMGLRINPRSLNYYKAFAYAILPMRLIRTIRKENSLR